MPLPDESVGFPLLGLYGLVVFLLFRVFLSRLAWIDRLRSNLLFIPVVIVTIVTATLTLGGVLWATDLQTAALFGLVILAPFGGTTLRAMRSEQRGERRSSAFKVTVAALGIAMSSYWMVAIVAFTAAVALMGGSPFGVMFLLPILAGIIVFVPAGYLISEMRHPYRNFLVAAIGPGLLMMMMMSFYWFEVLGKGF